MGKGAGTCNSDEERPAMDFSSIDWKDIENAVAQNWTPLAPIDTLKVNEFLLKNSLPIKSNPCVSPDFCLDWPTLSKEFEGKNAADVVSGFPESAFCTAEGGEWRLAEKQETGDTVWLLAKGAPEAASAGMEQGIPVTGEVCGLEVATAFPASFANLLVIKNLVLCHDAKATIFPTASGSLETQSLGLGARMTAMHYPATEWAMATLNKSMTGNQNSIPRELVYDINEMLAHKLETIAFPFIGCDIPEGHQGTSVEGMSHCSVLSKLKTGFHKHQLPWGFNADHQPIGGKFDKREDELVRGCVLASYITFDISHEMQQSEFQLDDENKDMKKVAEWVAANVPADLTAEVKKKVADAGVETTDDEFNALVAYVWMPMKKMKVRDCKYKKAREVLFQDPTKLGSKYFYEMSIDELPGLTSQATLATVLALCDSMGMKAQFVAPAFGFQKNCEYPDNTRLKDLIEKAWVVCKHFGVSIGFHSGSGKSAENYQQCGAVCGGKLEVKTSGRYTYELGRALFKSKDASDQKMWKEWYAFTVDLACNSAMQDANPKEQEMARTFILASFPEVMEAQAVLNKASNEERPAKEAALKAAKDGRVAIFASREACKAAIESQEPSPDHMLWFEYNFLWVLAKDGKPDKAGLGCHYPEGFQQRARFYGGVSDEGQLNFAKYIAEYIIFLAKNTNQVAPEVCDAAMAKLEKYTTYVEFLADITPAC